jgi:hypothetical protein
LNEDAIDLGILRWRVGSQRVAAEARAPRTHPGHVCIASAVGTVRVLNSSASGCSRWQSDVFFAYSKRRPLNQIDGGLDASRVRAAWVGIGGAAAGCVDLKGGGDFHGSPHGDAGLWALASLAAFGPGRRLRCTSRPLSKPHGPLALLSAMRPGLLHSCVSPR